MDNEAYKELRQSRERHWNRSLHAQLLNKLADDGCPLVVMDIFFGEKDVPNSDQELAAAMRRLKSVVLMAKLARASYSGGGPSALGGQVDLPDPFFLSAAKANWGVAWFDPDADLFVQKHWPFPSPGSHPSLSWTAARLAGAELSDKPEERWLRFYDPNKAWAELSYNFALNKVTNYFRDKIVFIGN
jgi:CHASE2 domain-containing sensor protein